MTEITEQLDEDGMRVATYTVDENGVKNGPYKIINNALDSIERGTYVNGIPDGPYQIMNKSYSEEGSRKNGKLHGICKQFLHQEKGMSFADFFNGGFNDFLDKNFEAFINRVEVLRQEFNEGMPVDGPFLWGKIFNNLEEGFYQRHKKNGTWKSYSYRVWNSDGSIRKNREDYITSIKTYKDDVLDGPYWDKSKGIRGQYEAGKQEGEWTKETSQGTVVSMDTYKNGKLVGPFFSRQPDSRPYPYLSGEHWVLKEEGNRNERGQLHGLYISYWPNGKIKIKCNYENNVLSGPYEEYTANGTLKRKGVYENNKFFTGNMKQKMANRKRKTLKNMLALATILPPGRTRKALGQAVAKLNRKISTK